MNDFIPLAPFDVAELGQLAKLLLYSRPPRRLRSGETVDGAGAERGGGPEREIGAWLICGRETGAGAE